LIQRKEQIELLLFSADGSLLIEITISVESNVHEIYIASNS